jgi:hypothetical protein
VIIPHSAEAAPAKWRTAVLPAGAAALLLAAGCSTAAPAGPGANPAAASGSVQAAAPESSAPQQWRLVRASGHLHDITLAVPACKHIARIAIHESKTRAVITVYADTGRACTWQAASQRTVFLTQPVNCERRVIDGATSRPPEFASDADTASVTFACPASISQ